MNPDLSDPADPARHAALTAFLRGIEVRAWVFALRQAGDEARAEAGLARAFHDFLAEARATPLGGWPMRFWSCLLRQPGLASGVAADGGGLAALPAGPRAALLLRLVAGLDVAHAAQALGVSQDAYEKALHRALGAPGLDPPGVEALRAQLQAQIHDAPAAQRQLLAAWRDEAVLSLADLPAPRAGDSPGRGRRWLVAALALTVAAAGAWGAWRSGLLRTGPPPAVVDRVAPPPAMTDAIAVTHPDYLLVARPADEALARELPFLSWMAAATLPAPTEPAPPSPAEPPAAFEQLAVGEQALLTSAREVWAELDLSTRRGLLQQARDWIARTAPERERLRADLLTWDRRPAPEHARRRTPMAAWDRLDATDQAWVRQAAARVASLPAGEQQALRAQFAESPPDTQSLWWLGPGMGQELAPFSSLFAYLPEADRPALLQVLRELDPDARADLSLLAPRLNEAQRQALRRELIAAAPAERAALIRARL